MSFTKREYRQRYYQEHKEELCKYSRDYRRQHRDEILPKLREYRQLHNTEHQESQRRTRLYTRDENGKAIYVTGLNKRPYPGSCEICKGENSKLCYHHWDDNNYSKGIWVCVKCHTFVEMIEKDMPINELVEIYKGLKKEIETEYINPSPNQKTRIRID
jgi:hypothetical protein